MRVQPESHLMELRIQETEDDITLIGLDGGLDSASIRDLNKGIDSLLDTGRCRIIVDCTNLNFVSSAGIGALVTLHRRITAADGQVKIAGATGSVFEVLELMNLGSILDLCPDVEHARQALQARQDGTPG
jgi:anti-anti-sigma factor